MYSSVSLTIGSNSLLPSFSQIFGLEHRNFVALPHCTATEAHKHLCLVCPQRESFYLQAVIVQPYPRKHISDLKG